MERFQGEDVTYESIAEIIKTAADHSMPKYRKKKDRKTLPYWNDKCKEAVRMKRRRKRIMQRTKNLEDCVEFRKAKAFAQRTIRSEQQSHWRSYCSTLNEKSKVSAIWRMSKKMVGIYGNKEIPTIVTNDGQKHVTNEEKANAIADCIRSNSSDENFDQNF